MNNFYSYNQNQYNWMPGYQSNYQYSNQPEMVSFQENIQTNNPYSQYKRQYYENMGNYASQQIMPQPQQYNNINYYQPQYSNMYYQDYRYESPQIKNQVFSNAYNNGQMKFSEFVSYTDPQEIYYAQQQPLQQYPVDAWGYQMGSYQSYIQQQQEAQKIYEQQLEVIKIGYKVAARALGNTIPFDEFYNKTVEYNQKMQMSRYQLAVKDAQYQQLDAIIERCNTSRRKGYISPAKQAIIDHMNEVYNARHQGVPDSYTLDQFLNEGIGTKIIFNTMKMEEKKRSRELFRLFDDMSCKNAISHLSPAYDPISGLSAKGFKINKNDIDITLDPAIEQREYSKRRQAFIDSIMKDKRDNLASMDEALARRLQNG